MNNSPQKAITGHYVTSFGLPLMIDPRPSSRLSPLAILEFGTSEGGYLCTNGMSKFVQVSNNGHQTRTELYLRFKTKHLWMNELLEALVEYVIENCTYLAEYDTIPVDSQNTGENALFSGILITPPSDSESKIGVAKGIYTENILFNSLVGISSAEMDFAISNGGESLWKKLEYADLRIDNKRASVL